MGTDPQRRMLNPSRESDWEDRKEFLYDLYMLKNLSLAKVVEEMSVVHSFRASERMYKRRFMKWEWFKYSTKRFQATSSKPGSKVEICKGKTTRQTRRHRQKRENHQNCDMHRGSSGLSDDPLRVPRVSLRDMGCENQPRTTLLSTAPVARWDLPRRMTEWTAKSEKSLLAMSHCLNEPITLDEPTTTANSRCPSTADDHFDVGGPPTPRQDTIMNPATLLPMEICVNSVPILSGRGANLHNIGDLTSLPANEGSQNLTAADYEVKDLIGSQALATIISACISLFSAGLTLTLSPKISMYVCITQVHPRKAAYSGCRGMKSFFDKDNQLGYEKNLQQNKSRPLPLRAVHIASYMDTESFTGVDDLTESLNEAHEQICQLQSTLAGLTRAMQEFRGCRHDGGIL
ncbi:Clr5 domain-containing protein [Colletotrichum acutatum]|uniref:Clr5 domain-containing protein n=1 Tax=Glomerella acutata TaxID=27357 RepID=A0AAD8UBV1_GLOAC|nr:Clr5 domain-containing protein [Colletotrichum acutatum]KAK1710860.1 Clr5 domain-containing protein [Colletotrichum acutatum]